MSTGPMIEGRGHLLEMLHRLNVFWYFFSRVLISIKVLGVIFIEKYRPFCMVFFIKDFITYV